MIKHKMTGLILCLLVVLFTGCGAQREEAKTVSTLNSTEAAISQENSQSGKAEASDTVKVVSKLSGKTSAVNVDVGSEVTAGQTLLQLDARDLAAAVDVARANLDSSQITYQTAMDNEERAKMLLENGAIGPVDYENNYKAVLERAKASVDLAQANLDKAQIAYSDCTVTAPISGVVTEVNVKAGELVSAQSPFVVIVNLDEVKVKLYINEKIINSLTVGQSCRVELPAIPDQSFEGTIISISDKMSDSSKGYLVNITVKNPEHVIKDGMHVEVDL
jgi:cobalt-zinc-cadmium efflux system membrane fusion protein